MILGGGDTGADCLGTAHRQGARAASQIEIMPRPPGERRASENPWPVAARAPNLRRARRAAHLRSHHGQRLEATVASRVSSEARRDSFGAFIIVPDTEVVQPAGLVLVATGFTGVAPSRSTPSSASRSTRAATSARTRPGSRGSRARRERLHHGDARRGAGLIVWAIAEGRIAAASSTFLEGRRALSVVA
ncbi:MAG: hypothetical protein U0271_10055 [Polyangiaceae bacterium]